MYQIIRNVLLCLVFMLLSGLTNLEVNNSSIKGNQDGYELISLNIDSKPDEKLHNENKLAETNTATKQCVNSLPNDSFSFGYALATQDDYLVIGDPHANHIVIYTRNTNGEWVRTREISPPKKSTAYKVKSGFGHSIALDGNILIIGMFTVIKPENSEAVNPKDFYEDNGLFSTSTAIYQTKLDKPTSVKRIDLPGIPTKGAISNNMIVVEDGKIGFIFSQRPYRKRINQVYVLSNGKINKLSGGKLIYRYPSNADSYSVYGTDIALKNNLLLVSVDSDKYRGGVWLFNLNSPKSKPQKITLPYTEPAIVSVAISDKFMAISNIFRSDTRDSSKPDRETLIGNIATGLTTTIDGAGGVSLDGNILKVTRSISNKRNAPKIVEVFRLDNDATPHLIQKHSNVESSSIQNKLLITKLKTASGRRICTGADTLNDYFVNLPNFSISIKPKENNKISITGSDDREIITSLIKNPVATRG